MGDKVAAFYGGEPAPVSHMVEVMPLSDKQILTSARKARKKAKKNV